MYLLKFKISYNSMTDIAPRSYLITDTSITCNYVYCSSYDKPHYEYDETYYIYQDCDNDFTLKTRDNIIIMSGMNSIYDWIEDSTHIYIPLSKNHVDITKKYINENGVYKLSKK